MLAVRCLFDTVWEAYDYKCSMIEGAMSELEDLITEASADWFAAFSWSFPLGSTP